MKVLVSAFFLAFAFGALPENSLADSTGEKSCSGREIGSELFEARMQLYHVIDKALELKDAASAHNYFIFDDAQTADLGRNLKKQWEHAPSIKNELGTEVEKAKIAFSKSSHCAIANAELAQMREIHSRYERALKLPLLVPASESIYAITRDANDLLTSTSRAH